MSELIDRQAAIDVVDSETISTNPEHFKSSEKFIEFMDDSDISSFGKWQWSNGFNTALVAVRIDLKNLPSAQPEIIRCKDCVLTDGHEPIADGRYWCMLHRAYMYYCSAAERRSR